MKIAMYVCVAVLTAAQARGQPTNAAAGTWQVVTNRFGDNLASCVTFTYDSELSGTQHVELNREILERWAQMMPVADQSGMTQALVVAKGNPTNTPPEWRKGQCLRFQRTGPGQWILKSLCSTNRSTACSRKRETR